MAIGAGTVSVETADIVLVRSNPPMWAVVVELARGDLQEMVQNLIWATGYNALAYLLPRGVLFVVRDRAQSRCRAVLMSVSTVVVALNAKTRAEPPPVAGSNKERTSAGGLHRRPERRFQSIFGSPCTIRLTRDR